MIKFCVKLMMPYDEFLKLIDYWNNIKCKNLVIDGLTPVD